MVQEKLQEFKDDFALLIEAGFIGVKQLDEVSATRIFCAAQVLSRHSVAPQVGLGYIALNKLEIKKATAIFEGVVQKEPENQLAQTFLGMCFLLTKGKRKKGEKIIQDAMNKTNDPTIKNLGAISLEWAEKDLSKQSKAPFFVEQQGDEEGSEEEETDKPSEQK